MVRQRTRSVLAARARERQQLKEELGEATPFNRPTSPPPYPHDENGALLPYFDVCPECGGLLEEGDCGNACGWVFGEGTA